MHVALSGSQASFAFLFSRVLRCRRPSRSQAAPPRPQSVVTPSLRWCSRVRSRPSGGAVQHPFSSAVGLVIEGKRMEREERVRKAEALVEKAMKGNDASHDAAHVWRVRDLALSLASEEGLSSDPNSMEIVELAALLHDIGDYKYLRDPSEEKIVENFLEEEGVEENKKSKILKIIKGMGFKEEVTGNASSEWFPEFGVVQDADRLDAIGAIGIARCFTFGGSRKRVLHDPAILPRSDLSKEQYINKEEQTTINHFHEKLLKLKDMMKTKAGQRRAERRHKFMEEFVKEFYDEWNGLS